MPKWLPKVMNNEPKWKPGGGAGSIYFQFLSILGESEKTWFFDEVPGRPKNKENRPVERQRLEKRPPGNNNKRLSRQGGHGTRV